MGERRQVESAGGFGGRCQQRERKPDHRKNTQIHCVLLSRADAVWLAYTEEYGEGLDGGCSAPAKGLYIYM